jgi:hypothetical protein
VAGRKKESAVKVLQTSMTPEYRENFRVSTAG